MRRTLLAFVALNPFAGSSHAGVEGKTLEAPDEAVQFARDTIVIGMLATPYGTGWTDKEYVTPPGDSR